MATTKTSVKIRERFGQDVVRTGIPSFLVRQNYDLERFVGQHNVFTIADTYFYRGKRTSLRLMEKTLHGLSEIGMSGEVLGMGDHFYAGFEGGAKPISIKSSFMWVVVRVSDESA